MKASVKLTLPFSQRWTWRIGRACGCPSSWLRLHISCGVVQSNCGKFEPHFHPRIPRAWPLNQRRESVEPSPIRTQHRSIPSRNSSVLTRYVPVIKPLVGCQPGKKSPCFPSANFAAQGLPPSRCTSLPMACGVMVRVDESTS